MCDQSKLAMIGFFVVEEAELERLFAGWVGVMSINAKSSALVT